MKDNPKKIAEHLIKEHGLEDAIAAATDGIANAHGNGNFYDLSIWREVRNIHNDR